MTSHEIFHRAEGGAAPDLERLMSAVPAIVAEAGRLRAVGASPSSRIVAAGLALFPRLAVATLALALAALVWPGASRSDIRSDESRVLDAWLVTGTVSGSVADLALDAILRQSAP